MTCIIVDDEPLAREGIKELINTRKDLTLLHTFNSAYGVLEYLGTQPVDLIFLDIEMPGDNGIEFARGIPDNTLVIFTTAYSEYALESYDVDAVDYLVKPISVARFDKAVDKAVQYQQLLESYRHTVENVAEHHIQIMSDRRHVNIAFDDLLFIEGIKDYVVIHTPEEKHVTWMNLKTIHAKLPARKFIRVSKRFVVNLAAVTAYDSTTVSIRGTEITLGKAFQSDFYQAASA